ncbi:NAD(P)/FAD-dependent oxidoreductase [Spongiactinospora sp. TRM90649]|uniref:phytoene desaturase family protein n=1 Tax=Spongiactinospora sp. TRM90649 TaxID=3031114 RepID=UPI0023F98936|nr:NAD(P)/FAD-dependent oxidoreductase [Spongiactinospora sp. TRM90649]MDF5755701.1 NAD(P)/FAD-dependent oxidoreductase [Spongiactinospora sp. TRM90649]
MRADGFDAVVVGSGPNGLTGALTLASAGRRVLLVEGAERFGGGLRTEELTLPGYAHDVCASVLAVTLASPAFRELDLKIDFAHPDIPGAHPLDDGPAVLVHRDPARTAAGLGRDGIAWLETVGAAVRAGTPLIDTLLAPLGVPGAPLAAARFGALGLLPATALARTVFRGERARAVLAGMSAHSMLDLGAALSAGYGLTLATLAHLVGWPVARGGSQTVADAMVARLRELGGEAVSGQWVGDLAELPAARTVLLDVTPRQFLRMAGHRLPPGYRRGLARFRYGPGVFKLDWALSGPVPWRDPAVARAGTVHLGGTFAEIALSEAEVTAGRHPRRPYVLLVQPCAADPSRAPEGRHTLWAYCHVPNGSTVDMTEAIEAQIERFAPGFRDLVLARAARGPAELERRNPNLVGGDIGGGLASLWQFACRPVLSPRPWCTPLRGVYLCSSSTPPGGGAHGMGGRQAARLALREP